MPSSVNVSAELEIFQYGHVRKKLSGLGNLHQAQPHDALRRHSVDERIQEADLTLRRPMHAADGSKKSTLPRSIGPDQGHDLALAHMKRNPPQHLNRAISSRNATYV